MAINFQVSPTEDTLPDLAQAAPEGRSLWQEARRRLAQNHLAVASIWGLGFIVLFCLFAPLFSPYPFSYQNLNSTNLPPSAEHWFGTDQLGRDQLTRIAVGGRVSLAVGLITTCVALVIGVTWGGIAGYLGGRTASVMMRIVDVLYAMPFTIMVILLMTLVPKTTWIDDTWIARQLSISTNIIIMFMAIGAVEWLTMARIVFGQVKSLKNQEFVEAAVALGLRKRVILVRHLLPNVLGVVAVYTTLTVPTVILLESFLSFLGLGVKDPLTSLGTLIKDGANNMVLYPYQLIIPAIFFSFTLFCMNFIGDGLRDALDPKSSRD